MWTDLESHNLNERGPSLLKFILILNFTLQVKIFNVPNKQDGTLTKSFRLFSKDEGVQRLIAVRQLCINSFFQKQMWFYQGNRRRRTCHCPKLEGLV